MNNNNSNSGLQQFMQGPLGSFLKQKNLILGIILLVALLGFEIFNFSTTEYALDDLLGQMRFAGIRWATILSIAFCGIDFAGVARLFTSSEDESPAKEIWFLFIAWLLAATMNATLTWWGVSMALVNHSLMSTAVVDPGTLVKAVPIFVAVLVWVVRILLISSISSAGSKMLGADDQIQPSNSVQAYTQSYSRPQAAHNSYAAAQSTQSQRGSVRTGSTRTPAPSPSSQRDRTSSRPQPQQPPEPEPEEPEYIPEPGFIPSPAYHGLAAKSGNNNSGKRQ